MAPNQQRNRFSTNDVNKLEIPRSQKVDHSKQAITALFENLDQGLVSVSSKTLTPTRLEAPRSSTGPGISIPTNTWNESVQPAIIAARPSSMQSNTIATSGIMATTSIAPTSSTIPIPSAAAATTPIAGAANAPHTAGPSIKIIIIGPTMTIILLLLLLCRRCTCWTRTPIFKKPPKLMPFTKTQCPASPSTTGKQHGGTKTVISRGHFFHTTPYTMLTSQSSISLPPPYMQQVIHANDSLSITSSRFKRGYRTLDHPSVRSSPISEVQYGERTLMPLFPDPVYSPTPPAYYDNM